MTVGFTVEAVRPPGPDPVLYWNDDAITMELNGYMDVKNREEGCTAGCPGRRWQSFSNDADGDGMADGPNDQRGYGNINTLNTWWFSNTVIQEATVETPSVVSCELSGPAGFCDNEEAVIDLTLSFDPEDGSQPATTITWDGPGIVDSNDEQATVNQGGTYTATVEFTTPTGEMCSSTCSFDIEAFETPEVKIDTTIEFNSSIEIAGNVYDSDILNDTISLSTVEGCDSLVIVCVTVDIPDVVLTCELTGPEGICEGDTTSISLTTSYTPIDAPAPEILSTDWTGFVIDADDNGATVFGGEEYTATVTYVNLVGDTLTASCNVFVDQYPVFDIKVDTLIAFDTSTEINGEVYDSTGTYVQELQTINGCDSIVTYCVTEEIPDVVLTCELSGPAGVCESETAHIVLTSSYTPDNAPAPEVLSTVWSGTGIISSDENGAEVTGGDTYTATITYVNLTEDTLTALCDIAIDQYPEFETKIDTIIEIGQTIEIGGESYDAEGTFVQEIQTVNGCDSIVTICITPETALLCYDLDNCKSIDYSRFTPKLDPEFDCGDINGSFLSRENPEVNGHSCADGVVGNAICISSVEDCEYDPGNEKSAIIDVTIYPEEGKAVRITGLNFFERAPEMFTWLIGREGLNNYPTL